MLTVGSTFSGVGGIDLGFEQTGRFETVWMSEVDRHASAVLAHRWPDVPNLGDINAIGTVPTVDVIAGGFPCQDYSVAGNRGGLAGDRGALWWQLHRLVDQVRPTWFVGENVPGLLSSNAGRDFRTIIESLGELGYACVWRVLDSQWFGVAQRRRRVVIVGHSGGRPRPEVLAVGQSLSGDSPPSRETGEDVAGTLGQRIGRSHTELDGHGAYVVSSSGRDTVGTITRAFDGKNYSNLQEVSQGSLVAQGAFRWQENQNDVRLDDPTQPPTSSQTQAVMFGESGPGWWAEVESAYAIRAEGENRPSRPSHVLAGAPTVRRLTPLECERLQGFPDQWTATGDYGDGPQPMSDTQRYRQMGNAVTVPVFRWVAERILEVHDG